EAAVGGAGGPVLHGRRGGTAEEGAHAAGRCVAWDGDVADGPRRGAWNCARGGGRDRRGAGGGEGAHPQRPRTRRGRAWLPGGGVERGLRCGVGAPGEQKRGSGS